MPSIFIFTCLTMICFFFAGCEKLPEKEGIYIQHQDKYVPLIKFPLKIHLEDVEGGFIRTYSLENEILEKAGTFSGWKHRFLINLPFKNYKIVRVYHKKIINYKYIRFNSYVHFYENETRTIEIKITGNHKILESELPPGRYVLVPWKGYSPIEPIAYGFYVAPEFSTKPPEFPSPPQSE